MRQYGVGDKFQINCEAAHKTVIIKFSRHEFAYRACPRSVDIVTEGVGMRIISYTVVLEC